MMKLIFVNFEGAKLIRIRSFFKHCLDYQPKESNKLDYIIIGLNGQKFLFNNDKGVRKI